MITEDYVSFETAKLLKEKGFDWETFASIVVFRGHRYEVNGELIAPEEDTIIPTLQMTMKWLREEHFLFIDMDPLTGYKWSWSIWFMNDPTQKMGESLQIIK